MIFFPQGDEILDTDIPSELEARIFVNTTLKVLWVLLQPLFYALRPLFVNPKPPTGLEQINLVVQLSFNVAIWYFFGGKAVVYLVGGTLLVSFMPNSVHMKSFASSVLRSIV